MGTFVVEIEVGDPGGNRFETVEALVDTGATYTMLPATLLTRLGVETAETQSFMLADGSQVRLDVGDTLLRVEGRSRYSPVVFMDSETIAVLGAVTLEIFGLGVDPIGRRLIPVDALAMAYRSGAR